MSTEQQERQGRWLVVLGLEYSPEGAFWERDSGLLCRGLREAGYDAWLVTLGSISTMSANEPLITGTLRDWEDPAWWRQWNAVGVVANLWGLPRFSKVAAAIREAGLYHLSRMDGDGIRTPRVDYRAYLRLCHSKRLDQQQWFPLLHALLATTVGWLFPRWHGRGTVEHLRYADRITIESSGAKQRLCRFLEAAGAPELSARISILAHPVTEEMVYSPCVRKEKLLLAVGRWNVHYKGPRQMMAMLGAVLSRRPDYQAILIGSGSEVLETLRARLPQAVQQHISIHGRIRHGQLAGYYQRAQIVLNTSVTESFCLALAEGLCCGASVVGPASIPAFHGFVSFRSGTLAESRRIHHLSDALLAEIDAWENGERDPEAISGFWRQRFHNRYIVQQILELINGAR